MRGKSGRVVLEVDPAFKHRLHARLASDGLTLKDWSVDCTEAYLQGGESVHLSLPVRLQRRRKEPPWARVVPKSPLGACRSFRAVTLNPNAFFARPCTAAACDSSFMADYPEGRTSVSSRHHVVVFVDGDFLAISEFPKWRKYLILLSFLDNSSARPVQIGGLDVNICHSRSTAVRGRRRSSSQSPPRGPFCRTRTGPPCGS